MPLKTHDVPDHYATLGLNSGCTADEIRKAYRELARKFHPDVCKETGAEQRFREINAAHQVLGDTFRRKDYDALRKRLSEPIDAPRPGGASRKATHQPTKPAPPQSGSAQAKELVRAIMQEAHSAKKWRKLREAELFCREALKYDSRCGEAYELLGDISLERRRKEEALAMFSYAVQLNPQQSSAQKKLERLIGADAPAPSNREPKEGANTTRQSSRSPQARSQRPTIIVNRPKSAQPVPINHVVNLLGSVALVALVALAGRTDRAIAAPGFNPFNWSVEVVLSIALAGVAAGMVLRINRAIEPLSIAWVGREKGTARFGTMPMLVAFGIVSVFLAAAIYAVFVMPRGQGSRSVERLLGASMGIGFLFALVRPESFGPILVLGGNLTLVTLMAGWGIADRVQTER